MEKVHVAGLYLVVSIVMLVLPHEGFSLNVKGLCDRTEPSQRIALLDNATQRPLSTSVMDRYANLNVIRKTLTMPESSQELQ